MFFSEDNDLGCKFTGEDTGFPDNGSFDTGDTSLGSEGDRLSLARDLLEGTIMLLSLGGLCFRIDNFSALGDTLDRLRSEVTTFSSFPVDFACFSGRFGDTDCLPFESDLNRSLLGERMDGFRFRGVLDRSLLGELYARFCCDNDLDRPLIGDSLDRVTAVDSFDLLL